ncbi:protease PrsW [Romboutsia maritimum]|uniref:Protease PrsW n=1 Tax=Romboutsia maritimum TaxID=2020948 RepID=A0A255HY89_9FIRM|nr:PrsW family glutamic-type intramembrane protease [Romboutsia maritimum]RDY24099.1 protease PrsW [Romboutsia maritimum]
MKLQLIILALSPIIACIMWIYLKDKYEKEPLMVLAKFFVLGIFISIISIKVESILMKFNTLNSDYYILYTSFVVAALTEEGLKAIVFIPNILKEKNFNEKLDGIIYSIFFSLGFATVENIIYILFENYEQVLEVGIVRGLISIPGHIMFAITMGYYISKYKFGKNKIKKREYMILAILVPILFHGIFDFILMREYRWTIVIFAIYIIILWKVNLDKLDDYMKISKKRFLKKFKHKNKK